MGDRSGLRFRTSRMRLLVAVVGVALAMSVAGLSSAWSDAAKPESRVSMSRAPAEAAARRGPVPACYPRSLVLAAQIRAALGSPDSNDFVHGPLCPARSAHAHAPRSAWSSATASVAAARPPTATVATILTTWWSDLRIGAIVDPNQRFPNPSPQTLISRLRVASRRYHFTVVVVEIAHPRQAAPLVIVKTADKRALATSTGEILRLIDPRTPARDDRRGWAYEGFFFEARDRHGVPFLIVHNDWRGPHAGGGQWASNPTLYPAPHG
jgi:hypothetical protein